MYVCFPEQTNIVGGKQVVGNHVRAQTLNRTQNNSSPMGHSHQKSCHSHLPTAAMSDL